MLPLGPPPKLRRSNVSVRIVSLTPPGVSSIEMLACLLDNLVDGTVCGIDNFLPTGEICKNFLYVIVFVGYYPAALHADDVLGYKKKFFLQFMYLQKATEVYTWLFEIWIQDIYIKKAFFVSPKCSSTRSTLSLKYLRK